MSALSPTGLPSTAPPPSPRPGQPPPGLVLAVAVEDARLYPAGAIASVTMPATTDAITYIARRRPTLVVIDWDLPSLDGAAICRAACAHPHTTVLITTGSVERVPEALRCGCHAVLLKPFSPNLAAARIGRLWRDAGMQQHAAVRSVIERGSNRTWRRLPCPACSTAGAVSFDYASHRKSWYACRACDHVWLGARQE